MSIAEQMLADALEGQKLAKKYFVVNLDFSPESLGPLDEACDQVAFALKGGKSEENVALLTRVWGAYLGEILRRHGLGEWSDSGSPAVARPDGTRLECHERVRRRLVDGAAWSLVDCFRDVNG